MRFIITDFLCKGKEPVEMQALHPLFAAAN